jgi:hypothetical protein
MDQRIDTAALQQRIEDLERLVASIRAGEDVQTLENFRRRTLFDIISAGVVSTPTSNEQVTTSVPVGGGNVSHAKQYDKRVYVDIDGSNYYIGLYE